MDKNGNHGPFDTDVFDFDDDALTDPSFTEPSGADFDASFGGVIESDDFWDNVVSPIDDGQPLVVNKELTDAEKDTVSVAIRRLARFGGRTSSAVVEKPDSTGYVTYEDFEEGPAQEAFLLCYGHAWNLFGKSQIKQAEITPSADRALNFYFCHDPDEMTFEDAGPAMSETIRRDVVRLRIMYEFWLIWARLPAMPFSMVPLPEFIENTSEYLAGLEAIALANVIWNQPGIYWDEAIEAAHLRYKSSDEKMDASLNALVAHYIVSEKGGSLYLTGANPIQEKQDRLQDPAQARRNQSTVWWSRIFS